MTRLLSLMAIIYSIFHLGSAQAALRVYKMTFSGHTYYAIALHPMKEEPFILGHSRLPDLRNPEFERGMGILSVRLSDGSAHDQGHSAVEFLTFDGPSILDSPDFQPFDKAQLAKISAARFPYEIVRIFENQLRQSAESWAFRQYIGRDRIKDKNLLQALQAENHAEGDGMGWILILDETKRILGTLSMAARTTRAPELPAEHRAGENFGDIDVQEVEGYPILNDGKIEKLDGTRDVGLTMELKRFIIDKEIPIDLMPVLFYFAEESTMTWRAPKTRAPLLYRGRPVSEARPLLVGRYVMATDRFMAVVNQRPPYRFKLLKEKGEDYFLHATREQFLSVWEHDRKNADSARLSGKAFLSASEIKGGMVSRGGYRGPEAISGNYGRKSLEDLKNALLKTCSSQVAH